ncbi:probable ERG10 - acetyl-CoA C-acetyltransferase, cytosolic [Melanopsichium pennsylvanicum]|uniref:Probable ERG10 - acetyl-CoA C-acetyltransferase, cytosolic n=2 Tax=Melanopsichium pennsylvanicum TaxID=63383 RepID=A0AAJ5C5W1_9BASI|nr:probable ERG10-acetyl-CoA C-acetyltransferase, cytosolic [Melanopsichium pennsylvanicum 4]SNX84929.1 probable ERG10 - acetyl-CoA C-acetyltransferase, cytosolic [Melanopsichium pennsylvanicum]
MTSQAFIVAAKRTPFGAFGGKLAGFTASQLGGLASKAALAELPSSAKVDATIFGNVHASDNTAAYLARHVGHHAGLPVTVPALTVNRLCGSGFQSIINAVHEIRLGDSEVVLTGGTESMSQAPYTLSGVRFGNTRYGQDLKLVDSLAAALTDQVPTPTPMGITAENLAAKYGISRQDCDNYALQTQQRYQAALADGAFKDEIVPVEIKSKKSTETFTADEHPRAKTTVESLAKLPSVFKKEGTVSAGNASGICDGAAANVIVSEKAVKEFGLKPLARILSYGVTACEPSIMGIGPVEASKLALSRAGLKVSDMDLIEVNEAFAAQFLSVQKELELPNDKTNVFGGAIALGHPLGASGARIMANLTHNLIRLDKKYALGAACIGGGQGIAIVIERV